MDEGFIGNILSQLISKNDGWNNGSCMWIIFLFFIVFMNNGGAWGGMCNRGNYATQQDVSQGFSFNTLENEVRANGRSLSDLGYQNLGQSQNVINAIANVNQNINNLCHSVAEVGCGINRNIDSVRYDMGQNSAMLNNAINSVKYEDAQNACGINRNIDAVRNDISQQTYAITANDTANTQKILDRLCAMEANAKDNIITQLRQDLQAAQITLGNAAQTTNIVNAVKSYTVPAVSNPYITPYNGFYYGTTTP